MIALPPWLGLLALAAVAPACTPKPVASPPAPPVADREPAKTSLACTTTYGGESERRIVTPTTDPYSVRAEDVQGRFEFKVVYVVAPADVAGVRIYTYQLGADAPVLLHEAKYDLAHENHGSFGFTGKHLVYDPRGRELEYYCEWAGH